MASTAAHSAPASPSLALEAARDEGRQRSSTRAAPAAAFDAARRMLLAGRRLDMQALAAELGISRATLYRWTGQREHLLGDVLWALSDELFARAKAAYPEHTGAPRIRAVLYDYAAALVAARPLHLFLQHETHTALRILTSRTGRVQQGTIRSVEELLREEVAAGAFTPRAGIPTLAFAIVRIGESFIYNDAIVAIEPQLDEAQRIVALLID